MVTVIDSPWSAAAFATGVLVAGGLALTLPLVLVGSRLLRSRCPEVVPLGVIGAPGVALCGAALSSGLAVLLAGVPAPEPPGGHLVWSWFLGLMPLLSALVAVAVPSAVLGALLTADENRRVRPALVRSAGAAAAGMMFAAPVVEALLDYPGLGSLLVSALLAEDTFLSGVSAVLLASVAVTGLLCAGLTPAGVRLPAARGPSPSGNVDGRAGSRSAPAWR